MIQKMVSEIIRRTAEEHQKWQALLALEGLEKQQLLFDLSTFECNKPIIAQMFADMNGSTVNPDLDTDSQRRRNILFQPGTMIRFLRHHDRHDHPVPSWGLVLRSTRLKDTLDRGKEYMVALNDSGKLGGFLYVYNPWHPAFEPVPPVVLHPQAVTKWLESCIATARSSIPPYVGTLSVELKHATGVSL